MNTERFLKPQAAESDVIVWTIGGEPTSAELERQLALFAAAGLSGVCVKAGAGLACAYMDKRWLETVGLIVRQAATLGLKIFICDDERDFSGVAGGLVTMNPRHRAKCLKYEIVPAAKFSFASLGENFVGAYGVKLSSLDGENKLIYYYKIDTLSDLKNNDDVMIISYSQTKPYDYLNGCYFADLLSEETCEYFRKITHEKYKDSLGEYFGSTIVGFFTQNSFRGSSFTTKTGDKDADKCPYTIGVERVFEQAWGYDILTRLPELFFLRSGENFSLVSWQYNETLENLYLNNFLAPYKAWCSRNKLLLAGTVYGSYSLARQASFAGNCMRAYAYFDIPFIEVLPTKKDGYGKYRELTSVVRQYGKKAAGAIVGKGTGWDGSFSSLKTLADFLAVNGIGVKFLASTQYTLKGDSKRDFPSGYSFFQPYAQENLFTSLYSARLNALIRETHRVGDLLVIHPIESVWGKRVAHTGSKNKAKLDFDAEFSALADLLAKNGVDYDYGDESELATAGSVKGLGGGTVLSVGGAHYKTVFVYGAHTLRSTTLKLLSAFARRGGKLLFIGSLPSRIGGNPVNFTRLDVYGHSYSNSFDKKAVVETAKQAREYYVSQDGDNVAATMRSFGDGSVFLFAANLNQNEKTAAAIGVSGKYTVTRLNLKTGKEEKIGYAPDGNFTVVKYDFEACEELALKLVPSKEKTFTPHSEIDDTQKFAPVQIDERVEYKLSEPNVLVLDTAEIIINGKNKGLSEIVAADEYLRSTFSLSKRNALQPWYKHSVLKMSASEGSVCNLDVRFRFNVALVPSKIRLALESPEKFTVSLNGNVIEKRVEGTYIDDAIKRLVIPASALKKGKNELVLSCKYGENVNLEPIYLLGSFGVFVKRNEGDYDSYVIGEMPKTLTFSDITSQGFPFYGGKIYYFLPLEKGYYKFEFTQPKHWSTIRIKTVENNVFCAYPPYECSLSSSQAERDYQKMENVGEITVFESDPLGGVQIEVSLNRRNTFGPFHNSAVTPKSLTGYESYTFNASNFVKSAIIAEAGLTGLNVKKLLPTLAPDENR